MSKTETPTFIEPAPKFDPDTGKPIVTYVEPETEEVTREGPSAEPVKQDLPEKVEAADSRPQSYVWLADGSVVRAFNEDLPAGGGTGTPHGFWQRGNKVYQVVAVYETESVVEGN